MSKTEAVTYQPRELSADVADQPATIGMLAKFVDTMTSGVQGLRARVDAQEERIDAADREFYEMAQELIRLLEEDGAAFEAHQPQVVVNVNGQDDPARHKATSDPLVRAISAEFASLKREWAKPVKPIYDQHGKLIGGQRVDSLEADGK